MFKLVLEKTEEPEIELSTSAGTFKKQESSRKTSISVLLTIPKPLTVWIIINCGKLWKRWEYQTTWPASWETYMQVRKQQLEPCMEQLIGSRLRKKYDRTVYCYPACLIWDSIFKSRDITLPTKVHLVKAMVFPVVMYGLWRRLSTEELMRLNCGAEEDSWKFLGLQGDPISPFWRRSALGFLCKEWC